MKATPLVLALAMLSTVSFGASSSLLANPMLPWTLVVVWAGLWLLSQRTNASLRNDLKRIKRANSIVADIEKRSTFREKWDENLRQHANPVHTEDDGA